MIRTLEFIDTLMHIAYQDARAKEEGTIVKLSTTHCVPAMAGDEYGRRNKSTELAGGWIGIGNL